MTTLEEEKVDQGIIGKTITKIESSQTNNHHQKKKYRSLVNIYKVTTPISINETKNPKP